MNVVDVMQEKDHTYRQTSVFPALLIALSLLAVPQTVNADSLTILLARPGKKETVVVVMRQQFDLESGFDNYTLETYAAPANRLIRSWVLAGRTRAKCRPHGHYEVYMKQVAHERDEKLAYFAKKGFAPPAWSHRHQQFSRAMDVPSKTGLRVLVQPRRSKEDVVMVNAKGDRDRLYRLTCPEVGRTTRGADCVVMSGIQELSLLDGGRMLAAVVRVHVPSSPARVHDEIRFFPLRRALRALGEPYPLVWSLEEKRNEP